VVTGVGMVTPLGGDVDSTWAAAVEGRSGVREISRFVARGRPVRVGGAVDDAWLPPPGPGEDGAVTDRAYRLLAAAAREAAAQARLSGLPDRGRVAVSVGGHGGSPRVEDVERATRLQDAEGRFDLAGLSRESAYDLTLFDRRRCDHAPGRLARALDARGAVLSIVSACAASAQAIGEGVRLLREGRADAVVAGGSEAHLEYAGFVGFVNLGALCKKYPSPEKASRPFDRRRGGFVMSEGAGALVLETLAHARARGAVVLGEVLGYGESADAYRITDVHPEGAGAVLAMVRAIADARLSPDAVEYVNAHGTATAINDPVETAAIKRVLGDRARNVPVSSNKSMLGHTIGAAGAVEAILTLRGIREGVLLPTINYETPDPKCDLDYVPNEARRVAHRVAISNSFGFGGQNACLVLGAA
jgi:3-oxoacyl-[acyl-carrier-protein] synthase II